MLKPARMPAFPKLATTDPKFKPAEEVAYRLIAHPSVKFAEETANTFFAGYDEYSLP